MKKGVFLACFLLLAIVIPAAAGAPPLIVEKSDVKQVVIAEVGNSIDYELVITNNGAADTYEIYSLVGVSFSPRGTFLLPTGTSKLAVKAFPSKQVLKRAGTYTFQYHLKGQEAGVFTDTLSFKIVPFAEIFEVNGGNFRPGDNKVIVKVNNIQPVLVENLSLIFKSKFFDEKRVLTFKPFESINISLPIDPIQTKNLVAGVYLTDVKLSISEAKKDTELTISYLELQNISVRRGGSGFLLRKTTTTKTNEGNVLAIAQIELKRDVLTRLFTVHSLEPSATKREGLFVQYSWEKELQPGESFGISSTTNYTFPALLLLLIIIIGVVVRVYLRTALAIDKRVSFVKTRGGEFALKVILHVKARKPISQVQLIDHLPGMTQLYEKFGSKPDKIEHATRRLLWNISHLNAGEERIYSYIIYTKINIIGRFELPSATATFHHEGKMETVHSNRAYFISETAIREAE